MGTSQRHSPSVSGEPNWGKSSASLTAAVKNLDTLDNLESETEENSPKKDEQSSENEEEQNTDHNAQEQVDQQTADNLATQQRRRNLEKRKRQTTQRFENNVRKSVGHLIKASGGKKLVSSGSSHSLGHSGAVVLGNILHSFAEIRQNGISGWLTDKGISLEGKTWEDVKDILFDACQEKVVGLDETAANQALTELLEDMPIEDDESIDGLEATLRHHIDSSEMKEIIDRFFGVYIFAHLSQNFEEKLEKKYDQEQVDKYMKDIKDQIILDVKEGVRGHDASHIDWNGEEGQAFMRDEFEKIIEVFDDDDD
jgi:hypothetical protein